jgi:RNA-directed DNA polymerase
MNTAIKPMYEWSDINWRKLERNVFKLQKRIYQASNRGDVKLVRRLQKLSSPYDGDWLYWSSRMGVHPEIPARVAKLLKRQKGKCTHCDNYFKDGDSIEVDHIIPKSKGGKESYDNWQLLHRHCHDTKTANDGSLGNKSSCNSAKPKPPVEPSLWVWENDMLVMTY